MNPSPKRHADLQPPELIEIALSNGEGYLADSGALCTATGERTGRSPQDRFIVNECSTNDLIDWGELNQPFSAEEFDTLWSLVEDFVLQDDHYVNHLEVGDHPDYYIPIKITTETAWHSLFARNIFVCPEQFNIKGKEKWRVLHAPNFVCVPERDGTHNDAAVIIHLSQRKILLAGMRYAGELKKALFAVQNFLLPEKDVLPMHCAANVGEQGDVSLFFGLSGTGKTTLSADEDRYVLGDDEHGWGKDTVFNLEGGCYAKTIDLCKEKEPVIWDAIGFGAIIENVVHNTYTRTADYYDTLLSENGRCCYPLSHIKKRMQPARAGEPNHLIFLTCDVLGVLPPVAKLSSTEAAYYFLSGYTAKVGSTETGSDNGITPIFSACFGSPFMPRPALEYTKLLMKRIEEFDCDVYLVNTGWSNGSGGTHGTGKRLSIDVTRKIIRAIQNDSLKEAEYETMPIFNLKIPRNITDINSNMLNPRNTWRDKEEYDRQAQHLASLFAKNAEQHQIGKNVLQAGPKATC